MNNDYNTVTRRILVGDRRQLRGYLVAKQDVTPTGEKFVRLGWSYCNRKDRFNREFGRKIALGRAEKASWINYNDLPRQVQKVFPTFLSQVNERFNGVVFSNTDTASVFNFRE